MEQWQDRRVSTNPANKRSRERWYSDPATAVRWRVVEAGPSDLPAHEGARCLLFACDTMIRRVWTYPADWRALSAEDLAALSWGT